MSFELVSTLVIIAVTIIMFISNKIDYGIICIFIVAALRLTGVMDTAQALENFANNNVILFGAMFIIGTGLTKTGITAKITSLVLGAKGKPRVLVAISCIAGALLSGLVNPIIAVPVLLPILIEIANETGISRSRLLYPMAASVNYAAAVTIMGIGAMNPISNNLMMQAGGEIPLRMIDFTIARFPFVVLAILYMVFFGYKLLPDIPNSSFEEEYETSQAQKHVFSGSKQTIAIIISVLTIVALFLSEFIKVEAWLVAVIGAGLYLVFGILKPKEAYSSINAPTMFLFIGILTLNNAMNVSGASQFVGGLLTSGLGHAVNPYWVLFALMFVVLVMTQIMSNMIIVVFAGIVAMVCVQLGFDPRAAVMGVQIAGCASILTPMASPVQAMIALPGKYQIKDFMKAGLPLAVISIILATFYLPVLFPFY